MRLVKRPPAILPPQAVAARVRVAAPGVYTVVFTAGSATIKQPLTLEEDPRVTKDGVTTPTSSSSSSTTCACWLWSTTQAGS